MSPYQGDFTYHLILFTFLFPYTNFLFCTGLLNICTLCIFYISLLECQLRRTGIFDCFSLLYHQSLEQYIVPKRCLINICQMSKLINELFSHLISAESVAPSSMSCQYLLYISILVLAHGTLPTAIYLPLAGSPNICLIVPISPLLLGL